jgi:MFS family permease
VVARADRATTAERLPRNVVVLSWVSFFQDAASEKLYPVMPLFLTSVLGVPVAWLGSSRVGLAQIWPFVLVARVVDRTGKGIRTSPRDALIADDTPPHLRGRAFGFHRAADTAGAVCGPLIGVGVYELLGGHTSDIRPLFFVAFIPAIISVALVVLVREARTQPAVEPEVGPVPLHLEYPRQFWHVLTFLTLFGIVNFSDAFLILRA